MDTYKTSTLKLAIRLDIDEAKMLNLIANAHKDYLPFHLITEKNGKKKERHIDSPKKDGNLKALLKVINKKLLITESGSLNPSLVGGVKKKSVMNHISPHIGKKTIVAMDLANCFPNISYKRIIGVWKKLGYNDRLARLLAKATTFRGYLPQGSPTSSMLCNFAMNPMAEELNDLFEGQGVKYTQFVDDICFSGNDDISTRDCIRGVYGIARHYEQTIRKSKTEIMDSKKLQQLMKVTVNTHTKASKSKVLEIKNRISSIPNLAVVSKKEQLSIAGQILYMKKFDPKEADHLEKIFTEKLLQTYDDNSPKEKDGKVMPCFYYRRRSFARRKCPLLKK